MEIPEKFQRETPEATIEALLSSYSEAEKRLSKSITPPSSDADPSEWAKFMEKAGAPKAPSQYKVPENIPEGFIGKATKLAAAANMNQDQFNAVIENMMSENRDAATVAAEHAQALKQSYGEDWDAAQARAARGAEMLAQKGSNIDLSDPAAFRAAEQLGATVSDPSIPADGNTTPEGPSKGEVMKAAEAARDALSSKAFSDRNDPNHGKANREYRESMEVLFQAGIESCMDPSLLDDFNPLTRFMDPDRNVFGD